ncbi:MAG: hypothetical protein AMXMBFR13_09430 [Phycisphaerae bacterium]
MRFCLFVFAIWSVNDLSARPGLAAVLEFATADSLRGWSFHHGPEFPGATGGIQWNRHDGHDSPGCLAMNFSFVGGGNYVQANWAVPKEATGRMLRIWLRKAGAHRVTFRAVDQGGQTFQKGIDYTFEGWQQLEVDLARWDHSFGGAGDGQVRFPLRQIGILIENNAEPRTGVLLIDNVELLPAEAADGSTHASSYVATDFGTTDAWRAGGGNGSTLQNGTWRYVFGEGTDTAAIHAGFSLLGGRPLGLRLVLEGDGSGHEMHAQLGSHFQVFHRSIGVVGRGEQTFEVPLDDLSTWKHHSGQNDGQVRYPLRITRIWLSRRPGGPASGSIRLKRLEVETRFRAEEAVLLIPDIDEPDGQGNVPFSVELRSLRPGPASGRLVCEYRGLSRRLGMEAVDLSLPGGAEPLRRAFAHSLGKEHFVEAVFQWIEPGFTSKPVSIGLSTVPKDPGSAKLDPASPMGAGLYLYRWNGNHQAKAKMTQLAELARHAGVKWTREEFLWHTIEPVEGQFNWSFYDQMVEVALSQGISVYGLLDYWSSWTRPNTQEGIDAYCRWVREVVRRYKDRIRHWEIWNEPNIFFWTGPKEMYATLLTQAYEAVKSEDPSAIVMGCSTSGIDTEFIRNVMAWGGKFDALTIHPYRGRLEDLGYIRELREVKKLVNGRDVWITEIGFPSQLGTGWSERRQASLAARVYLTSLASGAARSVSWYDFRNDGPDRFEMEQNFGLVRDDFRPKPAYRALATVCRTLAGYRLTGEVDVGMGAYAFRFTNGQADIVAVCAPDSGRILSFRTDADVVITDGMGHIVVPHREGGIWNVTLDTGFPVYVKALPGFTFEPVPAVAAVSLELSSVHPGDTLALRIEPAKQVEEWDLPFGWPTPQHVAPGGYRLQIPVDAVPGRKEAQAVLRGKDGLRLPFTVNVARAVIRL